MRKRAFLISKIVAAIAAFWHFQLYAESNARLAAEYNTPSSVAFTAEYASASYANYAVDDSSTLKKSGTGIRVAPEWMAYHGFGSVGVGMGLSAEYASKISTSAGLASMMVYEINPEVSYHFEYVTRQWFVPFVAAGPAISWVRQMGAGDRWGTDTNFEYGAGFQLLLNAIDYTTGFHAYKDLGVKAIYLQAEYFSTTGLTNAIPTVDLTHSGIRAGLRLEF